MGRARASLGFEDALGNASGDALDGFDPAEWPPTPAARARPSEAATAQAARASGFRSREPREGEAPQPSRDDPPATEPATGSVVEPARPRRRRTGRSMQLNLKAKPETIAAYCELADRMGWGLGETLERAVELLEREHGRQA